MPILKKTMAECSVLFVFLVVSALIEPNNGKQDGSCSKGWDRWNESCYYFSNQMQTWLGALDQCKILDNTSYLTDVHSKAENDHLKDKILEKGNFSMFTTYMGCFNNKDHKLLNHSTKTTSKMGMTNRFCTDYCRKIGYRYAGTEYYGCFCGMNLNKSSEIDISNCNHNCDGNQSEKCGGNVKISVYSIDNIYWLGGICMKNTSRQCRWFESRQPVKDFVNWEKSTYLGNGTCMDIDTRSYNWTANDCWKEKRFICKSSVKNEITMSGMTHGQLEENIRKLKKELTLNKSTLSKSIRKKTSISDHRKSSEYIGYIAAGIIGFIFGVIFLSDLPLLIQHAKCVLGNIIHHCQR